MKKKLPGKLLFLMLCLLSATAGGVMAQIIPMNPSFPSANIAGDKQSIDVSNDLYNGRVNVSLPLFNHTFEGISLPVTLSYTGSNGIKPDEIPSWVGYGWSLQAGGYVHRTVRGEPDERLEFKTTLYYYENRSSKQTDLFSTDFSYLGNVNKLNSADWYSRGQVNNFSPTEVNAPYPEIWDGSKGRYVDVYNHHPAYDLVPDEFTFSFGGASGKFYLNQDNKWVVESNDGKDYSITMQTGEQTLVDYVPSTNPNGRVYFQTPRIIKYLTITSTDGVKYYFGNTNLNATLEDQLFEYTRTSEVLDKTVANPGPYPAEISGTVKPTLVSLVPHTWYLSKVENLKTGSIITLNYSRQGFQFYTTKQAWGYGGTQGILVYTNDYVNYRNPDDMTSYEELSAISKVLTKGCFLTSINYPDGVTVNFTNTLSSQLGTDQDVWRSNNACFYDYEDIYYYPGHISGQFNSLPQLNNIQVTYNGELKDEVDFGYVNSPSNRLQLNKVSLKGSSTTQSNDYQFRYNNDTPLPGYASSSSDHWGFYNNKDFFKSVPPPYISYNTMSQYSAYREPDATYAKAEILTRVIYPTGGYMQFDYEGHKYSKKRLAYFSISDLGANLDAGGVRIAHIGYYSAENNLEYEKFYDYTRPGTGALSSGVLTGIPATYLVGPTSAWSFLAAGFAPVYTEGNHITYTYVAERQVGNGKTQYEFTNFDNGFNDGAAIPGSDPEVVWWGNEHAYARNGFKRGKVKLMQVFKEGGTQPVKETEYTYEHDYSDADKPELRTLFIGTVAAPNNRWAAVSERIYPDRVRSVEERTITDHGTITTKSTTAYDAFGNIKETKLYDSKGLVTKNTYTYNYEYPAVMGDAIEQGIKWQTDHSIKDAVVEKVTTRENPDGSGSQVTAASLITYKTNQTYPDKEYALEIEGLVSDFVSSSINGSFFSKDSRYKTPKISYDLYDAQGNVQQVTRQGEPTVSFEWGYGNMYPVAKIINAAKSGAQEYFYQSFEGANKSNVEPPFVGEFYFGDYQVPFVKPNAKKYYVDYWYYVEGPVFPSGEWKFNKVEYVDNMVLSDGQAIDEVRVYPEGAQMYTYGYSPLVGLTSESDMNGKTAFSEYDGLHRLIFVRDEYKNLLKKVIYNKLGDPTTNYYNTYLSSTFTKKCEIGIGGDNIYAVPAGTYSSVISQDDANQLAILDIQQNGQLWAQKNGGCDVSPIDITYLKDGDIPFTAVYENIATKVKYTFNFSAHTNQQFVTIGNIPKGTYNVTISTTSTAGHTFILGGAGWNGTTSASFLNVLLDIAWKAQIIINGNL